MLHGGRSRLSAGSALSVGYIRSAVQFATESLIISQIVYVFCIQYEERANCYWHFGFVIVFSSLSNFNEKVKKEKKIIGIAKPSKPPTPGKIYLSERIV